MLNDPLPTALVYQHLLLLLYRILSSADKDLKGSVFLEALAAREEPNRNGKMTVGCIYTCMYLYLAYEVATHCNDAKLCINVELSPQGDNLHSLCVVDYFHS